MPHYRGRPSLKVVESKFSHHVEMLVPEGGFGQRLGAIQAWHDSKGIPATLGRSRRENGKEYIRWCFADPDLAVEFADQFNGVIGRRHRSYQKK